MPEKASPKKKAPIKRAPPAKARTSVGPTNPYLMGAAGGPVPAIHHSLAEVMRKLSAIGKEQRNQQQGFMFRGIDQVYNELHPLMAEHQIITVPMVDEVRRTERQSSRGGTLFVTIMKVKYKFISGIDGSYIVVGPVVGEAMDAGDKGANKALAVAHKYALFQTFLIPTEKMEDPDFEAHQVVEPVAEEAPTVKEEFTVPVSPKAEPELAPTVETIAADMPEIHDDEGAKEVTDLMITVAESMHSESMESLAKFWIKNKKVIDLLDTQYHNHYQRLKTAFTELRRKLEEQNG